MAGHPRIPHQRALSPRSTYGVHDGRRPARARGILQPWARAFLRIFRIVEAMMESRKMLKRIAPTLGDTRVAMRRPTGAVAAAEAPTMSPMRRSTMWWRRLVTVPAMPVGIMTRRDVPRAIRSPAPTASSGHDDGSAAHADQAGEDAGAQADQDHEGARGRCQRHASLSCGHVQVLGDDDEDGEADEDPGQRGRGEATQEPHADL